MNNTLKKNAKRCLAILLAVVLVVSLSYTLAKDSRLHAEEDFEYYEDELEEEEVEELEFEDYEEEEYEEFEPDAVEELVFDDEEEVEEVAEASETDEDAEEAAEVEENKEPEDAEEAEESEEPEDEKEPSEESEETEESEEPKDEEKSEDEEEAKESEEEEKAEEESEEAEAEGKSKETEKEEVKAEGEEEFDAAKAYAEFQNMSESELNEFLASLSEEELAKLEKYAASLDDESEELVNSDKTYTVVFKDWDGTELSTQTVAENARAVPPESPEREDYVFNGWDADYLCVKGDMEVTAVYITVEQAEEIENLDVQIGFEDLTNEAMQFGDTIRLYSTVNGANPEKSISYQWQISRSGGLVWENVEGANEATYEFVIDESNYMLDWRLHVDIS